MQTVTATTPSADPSSAINALLLRTAVDADLRRKLVASPVDTIASEAGVRITAGRSISIVEGTAACNFFLPPFRGEGVELDERQLEQVAGGVDTLAEAAVLAAAVVVAVDAGLHAAEAFFSWALSPS